MDDVLQASVRNLGAAVDELTDLSDVMRNDVYHSLQAFRDRPTTERQPLARAFVRSCWAYVEGVTFAIKRFTFSACVLGKQGLSVDDHEFLADMRFVVDIEGNAELQPAKTRTLGNVKRTFILSAQIFDLDWKPNFGCKGWEDLRDSLQVRHRVTHPKSVAEFAIEPIDIKIQIDGIAWFISSFNEYQESFLRKHPASAPSTS